MKNIIKTAAIFLMLLSTICSADTEITALSAKQKVIVTLEKDSKIEFPIVRNPVDLMGKPIKVSTSETNSDSMIVPARYAIVTSSIK